MNKATAGATHNANSSLVSPPLGVVVVVLDSNNICGALKNQTMLAGAKEKAMVFHTITPAMSTCDLQSTTLKGWHPITNI